jgi:hypothetical protein
LPARCGRFGLFRFRSPLLSESWLLSFPPGTEMVHFPGFAPARLWIQRGVRRFCRRGLPHSEIPGSQPACGSPGLIAACHVLLRLLLPRHPPCALSSLTIKFTRRSQNQDAADGLQPAAKSRIREKPRESTALDLLFAPPSMAPPTEGRISDRTHQQIFRHSKNLLSLVDCPIDSVVKHRPLPA